MSVIANVITEDLTDYLISIQDKKKILLVENHCHLCKKQMDLLEENYEVHYAHSGFEGMDLADRYIPDLIIINSCIQDVDGYEFGRMIRKSSYFSNTKLMLLETPDISDHIYMNLFDSVVNKNLTNTNIDGVNFMKQIHKLLFVP